MTKSANNGPYLTISDDLSDYCLLCFQAYGKKLTRWIPYGKVINNSAEHISFRHYVCANCNMTIKTLFWKTKPLIDFISSKEN